MGGGAGGGGFKIFLKILLQICENPKEGSL
jgi:hypothetical protein